MVMFGPPTIGVAWSGNNPGKTTWGPVLSADAALKRETKLTRTDPMGALEWDRRADARQRAWEGSPFVETFNDLFNIKYNYPHTAKEDPVVVND